MGSRARLITSPTETAESTPATRTRARGERVTTADASRVNSGCAGRWPGLGMGARRSQASTSGGVMR